MLGKDLESLSSCTPLQEKQKVAIIGAVRFCSDLKGGEGTWLGFLLSGVHVVFLSSPRPHSHLAILEKSQLQSDAGSMSGRQRCVHLQSQGDSEAGAHCQNQDS